MTFLPRIVLSLALAVALLSPARAQNNWPTPGGSQAGGAVSMCLDSQGRAVPLTGGGCAGTLPVTVTATATLTGFTPSATGARGTQLAVTVADSSVALPTGAVVVVSNTGANLAYCNVNGVAATTSDQPITSGDGWFAFTIPAAITTLHCIATGGSTTVNTIGGSGLPTGTGGGSGTGGGGGGAVTIASGAVASGAYSAGSISSGAIASGAFAAGSIANGADVALGSTTDAASTVTNASPATIVAVLKEISAMEQAPASRAVTNAGTFAVQATEAGTWNIGTVTSVASILNPLPAGTAQIGHVIIDAGSTTVVTGTVAATESGTWNVGLNAGVNAIGSVTQGGAPWTFNLTQIAGSTLGAPSAYGTSPGAVTVPGVNAFVTTSALPTGAATSANQTNATQKTQVVDGAGNVIASTSNNLNVQCANCSGSGVSTADQASYTAGVSLFASGGGMFQTTATSNPLTNGQQGLFQVTANRALFSNLRNAAGTEVGTAAAPLQVSVANTGANGTAVAVSQSTANWTVNEAQINGVTPLMGNGVSGTGAQRVTIASDNTPFTIVANAGTNLNTSALATSANQPTNAAQGSTTSGQTGGLTLGAVTTASPTYTTAQTSPLSLDTAGSLRINCITGCSAAGGTSSSFGAAFPATGTAVGMSVGGNMVAFTGTSTNLNVNTATINAVTPLMGNGVTGTGSQRVTIASDNTAFTVNAAESGTWNITNISGTISLPTGAATQTTLASILTAVTGSTPAGTNVIGGVTQSGTWTVGLSAGAALVGKFGIDQTTPGTTNGVFVNNTNLAVVQPTGSNLHIVCDSGCSASGGTSGVDEAAFTYGTTPYTPIGGTFSTVITNLTSGQGGAVALTAARSMHVLDDNSASLLSAATSSIPAGTNLIGKVGIDQTTPGTTNAVSANPTTATSWGILAQASTTSGEVGHLMMGAVTTAAPTYTTAQTSPLSLGTDGTLRINCVVGCSSSGGTNAADRATFTYGTTPYTPIGGVFNSAITNLTSGQGGAAALTAARSVHVLDDNSAALLAAVTGALPVGANTIGSVGLAATTGGGCTPGHLLSAATTNSTLIKAGAGTLCSMTAINTTAVLYYLKLYNTVAAATCNTDTVVQTFPVPASASGAGVTINLGAYGAAFTTGISFCLTAAIADNDNTAAATGVAISYLYK